MLLQKSKRRLTDRLAQLAVQKEQTGAELQRLNRITPLTSNIVRAGMLAHYALTIALLADLANGIKSHFTTKTLEAIGQETQSEQQKLALLTAMEKNFDEIEKTEKLLSGLEPADAEKYQIQMAALSVAGEDIGRQLGLEPEDMDKIREMTKHILSQLENVDIEEALSKTEQATFAAKEIGV